MKILCIMDSLGSGGAERQLVGLARFLKKEGYEVTLMTYYPLFFYNYLIEENNISYSYVEKGKSRWRRFFALRSAIKKVAPDLVITFSPSAAQWISLVKLSGVNFRLIVSERSQTQKLTLKRRLLFSAYRLADAVVANSNQEKRKLEDLVPYLSDKLLHISNFVDLDKFRPPVEERSFEQNLILVIARLIPSKNALFLIDALKILKDCNYQFSVKWAGATYNSSYLREVESRVLAHDLSDNFELLGEVQNPISEYHWANLFCLPSFIEGHSNAISEAMSCGLPIVCSNAGDNAKLIEPGVNGFVFSPESPSEIANSLVNYLDLPVTRKAEFSQMSRVLAEQRFSELVFTKSYVSLIKKIMC